MSTGYRKKSGNNSSRKNASRKNASRATQSMQSYKKKRYKRSRTLQLIVLAVFILVVALCAIWGVKKLIPSDPKISETVKESELEKNVSVDGIDISGKSESEALSIIMKKYDWDMKAVLDDNSDTYQISNLIQDRVKKLLDEIYSTSTPKESYSVDLDEMDDAIAIEVAAISKKWNITAKNGSISAFDKDTNSFTYSGEQNGKTVDATKLTEDINTAIKNADYKASIEVTLSEVKPDISEAQAKDMYEVIGTFTTKTTSNQNRNSNIKLACAAIDGKIIQPGDDFSFNETTGNRSLDRGYMPAGAYVNGVLVEEPGGGVCQVSSTLYNAVIFSGLTTTERHAHSYEPSYVTPGEDAMVSYDGFDGPDMKFTNSSKSAIAIRASFSNQQLTMSIIGIPILEDGVTITMHSEKTTEYDPPEPEYVEDVSLAAGVEVISKEAVNGSRWVTNIIEKKNGTVVTDEFLHNSTYKGKSATIKRNTSGTVIDQSGTQASDISTIESKNIDAQSEDVSLGQNPDEVTSEMVETTTAASNQPNVETIPPNPGPASN